MERLKNNMKAKKKRSSCHSCINGTTHFRNGENNETDSQPAPIAYSTHMMLRASCTLPYSEAAPALWSLHNQ